MNKILRLSMMAVLALVCGTMSAQNNLLENGGFEEWDGNDPTNWASSSSASSASLAKSTDAHSGTYALTVKCATSSNKRLAYKELNLKAGTYNIEFYAKGGQLRPGYAIVENGSIDSQSGYKYGDYATLSATEWTKVEYSFTLEATTTVNLVVMNPKTNKKSSYTATDATVDDFSLTTTDGGIDTSVPVVDIANTPETAYSVAKAIELIEAGEGLGTKVYVKGKISSIEEVNTEFGNATYNISDDGEKTSAQVKVYRGYYLDGAKFTEEEQINLGDEVIVYGKLKDYNGTKELDSANHLYSINGKTAGVKNITVDQTVNAPAFNLAGQRVNAASKGIVVKNGKKFLNK